MADDPRNTPCDGCEHPYNHHLDWWDGGDGFGCGFACEVNGCRCDDFIAPPPSTTEAGDDGE